MWALENDTPLAAERGWVRDIRGAEVWLVAVKGTFTIDPDGLTRLADSQQEVCQVPRYLGEPGKSSLLCESDLVHTRQTTDVLLHGQAHAPQGKPTRQIDVMMKVANMTKVLRVFGDRRWKESIGGLSPTEPEPFATMPIIYERAFGGTSRSAAARSKHGWEPRNPVGTGFALRAQDLIGQMLPNIEDFQDVITSWKQRPRPAGFGPIARDWQPRLALAGTYDEVWQETRSPLLPLNFDDRFYQAAPEDQQAQEYLRGGEPVELFNLTTSGLLRFNLPRLAIGFVTSIAGQLRPHPARLHTVLIEPDHPRVTMVWHTSLACHPDVHTLKSTRVWLKKIVDGTEQTQTAHTRWGGG